MEEEAAQSEPKNLTAVLRHGCSSCRTTCDTTQVPDVKVGDDVVVRTERGVEYALILTAPEEVQPGQARPHVEVLRHAHIEDLRRQSEIDREGRSAEYRYCMERVRARDLPMSLVRVEKILEAKLLGDVSYCGRELCCSSWIREMKPVTMKMAKNQKSTLDPSKISGMCGRLLCCLRYEDAVYTEHRKNLPKRGKRVRVKSTGETGMVLHQEVLAAQCTVLMDRGGTQAVKGADIELEAPPPPPPAPTPPAADN
jgi:cell fate regulator YaaT (PSP1 superfamily)